MLKAGIVVLDSGCGPASWTLEMAEKFKQSKFHGMDVSGGVFPDEAIRPANVVELAVGNIAKSIPHPDNTFDYIHQRLLFAALTDSDWENVRISRDITYKCMCLYLFSSIKIIVSERIISCVEAWWIY